MPKRILHISTDLKGTFTYMNAHFMEISGFQNLEQANKNELKSILFVDATTAIEASKRLISRQSTLEQIEIRKPLADGTYNWTYWEFTLLTKEQNQPIGINCMGYDITQIKNAETDNSKIQQLINQSNVISDLATFKFNITDDELSYSKELNAFCNFDTTESITLHSFFEKIHPEDLHILNFDLIENLKKTKTSQTIHFRILDPFYEIGFKHQEGIFQFFQDPISSKEFIYGIFIDITKVKNLEYQNSTIITHLKSILDNNEVVITVINKDYKMVSFNQESVRVVELFGITPYIGQYVLELIPDSYKERIAGFYERAFKGETIHLDFNIYYDTAQYLSNICYYPIPNERNEIEFVVIHCKFNDLNDLKIGEKINKAKSIINFQELEKSRIAADLHDSVGQLLYAAKINLSLMKHSELKSTISDLLNRATDEIKQIINNSSQFLLENTTLKEAILNYFDIIFKKNESEMNVINFSVDIISAFEGNVKHCLKLNLFRIIQEIIQNVIKHASATNFKIKIKIDENYIKLFTIDDGLGFEYSKIGTGKGLENIMNRVTLVNGKIKLFSKYKKGTIFAIYIPFTK
ncbi:MAG: PAS domain S-box protein [Cytophagales bacterium]|nr:MAG: PAS domain S-box protein [Cytophagales bacterium]